MPTPPSTPFLGIDHIGIAVSDLQSASQTYRDVLGLDVGEAELLADRGLEVAFVNTGGNEGRIELLAPVGDETVRIVSGGISPSCSMASARRCCAIAIPRSTAI